MKNLLVAFFVGAVSGLTSFLLIKHLFGDSDKTSIDDLPESEPENEPFVSTETDSDAGLKVG